MALHPYSFQPDSAFWSRSVSRNFNPADLIKDESPLIKFGDKITSAGSCFASNLIPYIESSGFHYIRTEKLPDVFSQLGENLGYANFSAMYGNIYTARQLLQLYLRSIGGWNPIEDRWIFPGVIIDPFRPGLRFKASSNEEFDLITKSHLAATRKAFESADLFVFTLGLTEAWASKTDGSIFPACPGTISGTYDSDKHKFLNFSVEEIVNDLSIFITKLRESNKNIRFMFSVSPVPLVATGTSQHVLNATIYSKSVLRVAVEDICKNFSNVNYFPAYEIITGPQSNSHFFEPDRRNVSKEGIDLVMNALLAGSEHKKNKYDFFKKKTQNSRDRLDISNLSEQISNIECDEVMMDREI
jgi:hypothetical protein